MDSNIENSLIIPVYKNEENIKPLIQAINDISVHLSEGFEVIFVIDGSPDNSYQKICEETKNVRFSHQILILSRNFGSFTAIRTGMEHARGQYLAVMAADLQEPIELIVDFFNVLKKDSCDLVLGERLTRDDPKMNSILSGLYWRFYRKCVQPEIPKGGVDIFACNNTVKNAILKINEPNSSLIAQLFWVGFRRMYIPYHRKAREHGNSGWSFKKRIKYMLDSIFSFSDFPIMAILWVGIFSLFISFILGFVTLFSKISGLISTPGYSTTTLLILFMGSSILTTQGIIGCYLWRTFENTKKRPLSLICKHEIFVFNKEKNVEFNKGD